MAITYKYILNYKPKLDGTYTVLLRITYNGKLKRLGTGIAVLKGDFNSNPKNNQKWIKKSNLNHAILNRKLKKFLMDAEATELELLESNLPFSPDEFKTALKSIGKSNSFTEYFKNELDNYVKTHSVGYYKHLRSKYKTLCQYKADIKFSDITLKFLKEYKAFLIHEQVLNENSVISHLKALRTIFRNGMKEQKIEIKNPFDEFPIGEIKGHKHKLSDAEINKIKDLDLEVNSAIWHTRNYFLFSFYTGGIRISDLIQLKWNNIKDGRLSFVAKKSGGFISNLIVDQANEILNLYNSSSNKKTDFIFPILRDSKKLEDKFILHNQIGSKSAIINKNLKKIQDLSGLEDKLTFHVSRHSFADHLRKKKADIHSVKGILGHSKLSITEKYLKELDIESNDEAMKEAF